MTAPSTAQCPFHAAGGARQERHEREPAQGLLQERQLHLQRVLLGVRRIALHHLLQVGERVQRGRRRFGQRHTLCTMLILMITPI